MEECIKCEKLIDSFEINSDNDCNKCIKCCEEDNFYNEAHF